MNRLIAGFVAASVIPAAVLGIVTPLSGNRNFTSVALTMIAVYPFSAIATFVLGVPIFLVFRHFEIITWWSTLGAGFIIGFLVPVIIRLPYFPIISESLNYGIIGAASAFVFWLIWRKSRKSKDTHHSRIDTEDLDNF